MIYQNLKYKFLKYILNLLFSKTEKLRIRTLVLTKFKNNCWFSDRNLYIQKIKLPYLNVLVSRLYLINKCVLDNSSVKQRRFNSNILRQFGTELYCSFLNLELTSAYKNTRALKLQHRASTYGYDTPQNTEILVFYF